jgi:hypothetical protein
MKDIFSELKKKNWSEQEIQQAIRILQQARLKQNPALQKAGKTVYWLFLLVAIIGNFLISISLIPMMLLFSTFALYSIIIIIAFVFGVVFHLILKDIPSKYFPRGFIITLVAIINIALIAQSMYSFAAENNIFFVSHSPMIAGAVYAVMFTIPFFSKMPQNL